MSQTITSHSLLNISETVRDGGVLPIIQGTTNRKWPMRNRMVTWRLTLKGQTRLNTLRVQYLEISWRCHYILAWILTTTWAPRPTPGLRTTILSLRTTKDQGQGQHPCISDRKNFI